LRAFYGLDQSIPQQFITWLGQALSGDFGRSISLHQSVFELVLARLPATLELSAMATLIAVALGTVVALTGVYVRGPRRRMGHRWRHRCLFSPFPISSGALILLLLFGVLISAICPLQAGSIRNSTLPSILISIWSKSLLTGRFDVASALLQHMILPAVALALPFAALVARILKALVVGSRRSGLCADRAGPRLFRGRPSLLREVFFPMR